MRRRLSTLVAGAVLVAGAGLAVAAGARADGPPVPAPAAPPVPPPAPLPVPAPAPLPEPKPSEATGASEPARAAHSVTAEELERLVKASPLAFGAMLLMKFATALAGLVLVVIAGLRWLDVRRGLAPPLPATLPPPAPFPIGPSLAIAIVAVLGGGSLVLGLSGIGSPWNVTTDPIGVGIAATGSFTVPTAILVGLMIVRRRSDLGTTPWPPRAALLAGVRGFCVASLLVLGAAFVATWAIETFLHREPEAQDLIGHVLHPSHAKDPWLIALFGVLVAPVTEEVIFRGMLYAGLRTRMGPWVAACASAALFGAVHADLTAFFPLFVLAMVLARLYERTGSLLACTVLHVLNNATSLLPLFLLK